MYLNENKEELESIKDAAASLNTIFENIDEIRTVEANIALMEQVISNLEVIENAVANLDTLETADEVAKEIRNAIGVVEGLKTEAQKAAKPVATEIHSIIKKYNVSLSSFLMLIKELIKAEDPEA